MVYEQHVLDRAREWVGENYPELDGEAYDRAVECAAKDIVLIDGVGDAIAAVLASRSEP